jgi:hypothetical protein
MKPAAKSNGEKEDVVKKLLALVAVTVAAAAALATSASADYGAGAVYQVEISANAPTGAFWIWAELDPGGVSGDYQETDCIHLGGGHATDAAAHDSGSVTGWSVGNGMLTMTGVNIIAGLETATISVPLPSSGAYGHSNGMTLTVTSAIVPIIPVGATLTWSGQATQVQLAP